MLQSHTHTHTPLCTLRKFCYVKMHFKIKRSWKDKRLELVLHLCYLFLWLLHYELFISLTLVSKPRIFLVLLFHSLLLLWIPSTHDKTSSRDTDENQTLSIDFRSTLLSSTVFYHCLKAILKINVIEKLQGLFALCLNDFEIEASFI